VASIGTQIVSYVGVISMLCLLVSGLALLQLVQKAFDSDGIIWGVVSMLYPIGTYFYCRKNWDTYRGKFIFISGLVAAYLILWLLVKLF